jgi:hypothetical protein
MRKKNLVNCKENTTGIEHQFGELENSGQGKFESIQQDLTKDLEEVEMRIEEWTKKLDKGKEK